MTGQITKTSPHSTLQTRGMHVRRYTNAYAYGLILFCVLALTARFIFKIKSIFDPFEHDYAEGIILYQILHIFNFAEAYRRISEYPHIVFHYTPLYHMLANLLGRTGLDTAVAARMISLIASLVLSLICAIFVLVYVPRRVGNSVRYAAAFVSSAAILFSVSASSCGAGIRSDMLAVTLSVLGLYVFVRFGDRNQALWAFVLFIAAVYSKQTIISASAACLIAALLMSRSFFAKAVSILVVLGGGILALYTYGTSGGFLRHIFVYNVNPYVLKRAADMIGQHVTSTLPLLVCGLAMILAIIARLLPLWARLGAVLRRSIHARTLFCVTLFTLCGMVMSLATGKEGSAENYFLEWDIGIAILTGLFIAKTLTQRPGSVIGPAKWAAWLLPVFWVLSTVPVVYRNIRPSDFMRQQDRVMKSSYVRLIPLIKALPGPVVSEDMMLLVKANKQIPMETAIFYGLASKGVLDQEPFLERLRKQEISAIIVIHELETVFTAPMVRTIIDHYRVSETVGPFQLYLPISTNQSNNHL